MSNGARNDCKSFLSILMAVAPVTHGNLQFITVGRFFHCVGR